jgi:hypothetical protein
MRVLYREPLRVVGLLDVCVVSFVFHGKLPVLSIQ